MRILGFSKEWNKLKDDTFTTFRFARKDKDWDIGEKVQIVLNPRSKYRQLLGVAEIINKEPRWIAYREEKTRHGIALVSRDEAIADGFKNRAEMNAWMRDKYGERYQNEPMNKLTLRWILNWEKLEWDEEEAK